jgi:hypothetical protein
MNEKEVVFPQTEELDHEWMPDIVVGIDFGMTFTGIEDLLSIFP